MKTKSLAFWLFLLPVLVALFMVIIIPFIYGIYYSFTNWNGDVSQTPGFVGFQNYVDLLKDDTFINALMFTFKYSIAAIFVINFIGLSLALIVTSKIKSKNLLRTVFFMPNLIGGLILGFIWQFIFTKVFAMIGEAIGSTALQGWLSDTHTGFWGMVILSTWQMAGYIMIIYIAYLENVPDDLLEAAEIDGANAWQRFKNITFPMVAPAFTVCMFLTLSGAFKIYDQNLSLTNGGPGNSTKMLAMDIVDTAFKMNHMGEAQAKAVVFFLIVTVISLTQVYYNKKREVEM
ncbi:sugar ABC transporter permease [Macrococcus epidermidis]|uniref:Sugar ABC transporter permease n=2 Tax=Staphylococcaceae TaxID=90964 RepID=A0A395G9C2_9STAP|nr:MULTISPECIES: sugar ABC transporter permease [Macrococcus]RAI80641.1 sugar ABC transporter permease [Macrococcus goetzii]RAK45923.1 sugar ABC transporter permease [Macrococcus epidermidis]TDM41570.1 sugar ABC transporter permease [Macrococcus goetzii]TDM48506.1 sugar ABC transporter permease [Macrococcus goetzii]TDM50469.1 sugar ABC transporter permease [Macrococcus goetzii]